MSSSFALRNDKGFTYKPGETWCPPALGNREGNSDAPHFGAGRAFRLLIKESTRGGTFYPLEFKARLRKLLGLETVYEHGQPRTVLNRKARQIDYDELPLKEVASECLGADFIASLGNNRTGPSSANKLSQMIALREGVAPVTASSQQDVNAFSIYIGGLIELKFFEGYQKPEYIGNIIPTEPTQVNQQRIIGEASMNLPNFGTTEGVEYPNQLLVDRWVIRPPVYKVGQKAGLTREAVAFGLGGILLKEIEKGGEAIGYLKEYLIAATVQGVNIAAGTPGFQSGFTTNTFIYSAEPNATPNATYQTAAGTGASALYNYVNKATGSTGITSYLQVQAARNLLSLMREPETGYPIRASIKDILVAPGAEDSARLAIHTTQVFPIFGGSGTTTAGSITTGGGINQSPTPEGNSAIKIWASAIWQKVLVDSGISQANSLLYYYIGEIAKLAKWFSVWEPTTIQANNLSSELVERDIVGEWVYSMFGVPAIFDPHYLVQYTN